MRRGGGFHLFGEVGESVQVAGGGFGHAVERAHFQRAQAHFRAGNGVGGDHDNGRGPQAHEFFEEDQAVHARHFNVQGDDVRGEGFDGEAGFMRVRGLADDLDGGVGGEGGDDEAAHGGGVIHDEDADGHGTTPSLRAQRSNPEPDLNASETFDGSPGTWVNRRTSETFMGPVLGCFAALAMTGFTPPAPPGGRS